MSTTDGNAFTSSNMNVGWRSTHASFKTILILAFTVIGEICMICEIRSVTIQSSNFSPFCELRTPIFFMKLCIPMLTKQDDPNLILSLTKIELTTFMFTNVFVCSIKSILRRIEKTHTFRSTFTSYKYILLLTHCIEQVCRYSVFPHNGKLHRSVYLQSNMNNAERKLSTRSLKLFENSSLW